MKIIKLKSEHSNLLDKFDGTSTINLSIFKHTYMSNLKNYHAYALVQNDVLLSAIGFYESIDDCSWYWKDTLLVDKLGFDLLLNHVCEYNELMGRFKYYLKVDYYNSIVPNRYEYFDEYYVDKLEQCKFNLVWQILFNRVLQKEKSIIRCVFLKNEFRYVIPNGGNI